MPVACWCSDGRISICPDHGFISDSPKLFNPEFLRVLKCKPDFITDASIRTTWRLIRDNIVEGEKMVEVLRHFRDTALRHHHTIWFLPHVGCELIEITVPEVVDWGLWDEQPRPVPWTVFTS